MNRNVKNCAILVNLSVHNVNFIFVYTKIVYHFLGNLKDIYFVEMFLLIRF